jgi:hypothetical protein
LQTLGLVWAHGFDLPDHLEFTWRCVKDKVRFRHALAGSYHGQGAITIRVEVEIDVSDLTASTSALVDLPGARSRKAFLGDVDVEAAGILYRNQPWNFSAAIASAVGWAGASGPARG